MTRLVWPAAFAGLLVGLGLGLEANASGVVLGFYGLAVGALLGATYLAPRHIDDVAQRSLPPRRRFSLEDP